MAERNLKSEVFYTRGNKPMSEAVTNLKPSHILIDSWDTKDFSKMKTLKKDVESKTIRKIIVNGIEDLDTEFGTIEELLVFIKYLSDHEVSLISISDALDTSQRADSFIGQLIRTWNAKAEGIKADRIALGLNEARKKGTKLGRRESYDSQMIIEMRTRGMSLMKIAEALGTSKRTVLNYLNRKSL